MELVLSTFGTALNVDNNAFVVTQGKERQRLSADDVTSIQISKGASITSDAALLAIEKEIPVIFVDRKGSPKGRIWSPKYGSISTIRKGQLSFTQGKAAVQWIKGVLSRKLSNQQALIYMMLHDESQQKTVERSVHRIEEYRKKVEAINGDTMQDVAASLRGWEGMAARIYFDALNLSLPEHLRFAERSQHPALDAVNAYLNYGYGILYSRVEGALIQAGIDPYIGVLHRDEYNRPVLVYDVIEIYRLWIDYVVYGLACQGAITDDCYSIKEDGSYWLESLGRRILIQSVNDYLEEVVDMNGLSRSRAYHIVLYAQDLAQRMKGG